MGAASSEPCPTARVQDALTHYLSSGVALSGRFCLNDEEHARQEQDYLLLPQQQENTTTEALVAPR